MISVVLTTYNRSKELRNTINSILAQSYRNFEIIVSDDCSTDDTEEVVLNFDDSRIKYFCTPENSGYRANSLFALSHASGEYLTFICDDDELIYNDYFQDVISHFHNNNADMVFARLMISSEYGDYTNVYDFKEIYNNHDFFVMIEDMKFNYQDYFGLGTSFFKRDKFMSLDPFKSVFEDAFTTDITTISKYVLNSERIVPLNKVVYKWRKPNKSSISGGDKLNLVRQIEKNLAYPIDLNNYLENNSGFDNEFFLYFLNKRVEYSFYAILADKEALDNESNFQKLSESLQYKDNIYIYGMGWVGLELGEFLKSKGIKIIGFIDDYKKGDSIYSFEKLSDSTHEETTVIIASYKYKDIYNISKRLAELENVNMIDLYESSK